jgi:hypothetical protein
LLLLLVVGAVVAALGDLPFSSLVSSWLACSSPTWSGSGLPALLLLGQMLELQASITLVLLVVCWYG